MGMEYVIYALGYSRLLFDMYFVLGDGQMLQLKNALNHCCLKILKCLLKETFIILSKTESSC